MDHQCPILVIIMAIWVSSHLATTTATVTTTTTTEATTTIKRQEICASTNLDESKRKSLLDILESEFSTKSSEEYRRALDLIFIMDRSLSIGQRHFNESKSLVKELLTKLSEIQYIFVHQSYTRVAIITFGNEATVYFDGISDGKTAVDSCIITQRVDDLEIVKFTDASKISEALARAQEVFNQGKTDPNRHDPDQILWLFYDGECVLADCEPYKYQGKDLASWASELRNSGITIFTSGIGQWLDTAAKQFRVQELAKDAGHYECTSTWMEAISHLSRDNSSLSTAPLFSEAYKSKCNPSCQSGKQCACEVISRQYQCTDATEIVTLPPLTTTTSTTSQPPAMVYTTARPDWYLPAVIGAGSFGGVVFIILMITCCLLCQKRKIKKDQEQKVMQHIESQPIYGGPPLPPPPAIRQRNKGNNITPMGYTEEAIYANPGMDELSNNYKTSSFLEENVMSEYQSMPYPQSYENVELDDLEKDMVGWPGHLAQIKNSFRLLHLTVRSMATKRFAMTIGNIITEKDVNELEKIMHFSDEYFTKKIKIAGKTYEVDKEQLNITQVRAIQKGIKHVLWANKVYDYIIVGLAEENEDEGCIRAVLEIQSHLKQSIESSNKIEMKVDDKYDSSDYSNIYEAKLPERYSVVM